MWYAEKITVDIEQINDAGIPLRVIDLVRDPRDVLASVRAFTASGVDGFGRTIGMDENEYLGRFVRTFAHGLDRMRQPRPAGVDGIVIRYEDLVADLRSEAERIGRWLQIELNPEAVASDQPGSAHHATSVTPAASIGRWRNDLTDADAQAVADGLREIVASFGYDL